MGTERRRRRRVGTPDGTPGGTHGPRSHFDLRGHAAGTAGGNAVGVDGFAVGGAREHGALGGARATLGLEDVEHHPVVRAVVVDGADEHGGVGGCDVVLEDEAPSSPMPIRRLSKASLAIVSRATKTKPPSKSGISPAGVAGIGRRLRRRRCYHRLYRGYGRVRRGPRPPRPLASRPRPLPPSRGRFWPEGAMGGGAPPPSLTFGGDRSGWRTQLAMIASG